MAAADSATCSGIASATLVSFSLLSASCETVFFKAVNPPSLFGGSLKLPLRRPALLPPLLSVGEVLPTGPVMFTMGDSTSGMLAIGVRVVSVELLFVEGVLSTEMKLARTLDVGRLLPGVMRPA